MTTTPSIHPAPPLIYSALARARTACPGYVRKDTSAGQGRGVSHDQVTAHVREALMEAGVLVLPSLHSSESSEYKTKSGARMVQFDAVFDVAFVAVEDGSSHVCRTPACGVDQGDKAPGKAESYAVKTALLKALSIETGEDDESRVAPPEPHVSDEQAATLQALAEEVGQEPAPFFSWAGAESFATVPARRFPDAVRLLERKRGAK